MYDSMKDAKSKMAVMRRELEVSRELGCRLTAQNQALQHALNVLVRLSHSRYNGIDLNVLILVPAYR